MARGEYGDVHRVVLQTFMSKKVILEKEALELVRASARKYPECEVAPPRDGNELSAFFVTIDKEIGDLLGYARLKRIGYKKDSMAPAIAKDEPTVVWGLQSVKDDIKDKSGDLAKLMENQQYKDQEIYLFKLIIEELCTRDGKGKNGMLDHNLAINLCIQTKPKPLKVDDAMSCIDRLVEEEWLCFSEDPDGRRGKQTSKRITLGVRSMIDLQRFISETWPGELSCEWVHGWNFKWIARSASLGALGGAAAEPDDGEEDEEEHVQGREDARDEDEEAEQDEDGEMGGRMALPSRKEGKEQASGSKRSSMRGSDGSGVGGAAGAANKGVIAEGKKSRRS